MQYALDIHSFSLKVHSKKVLRHLNLTIPSTGVTVILGPSGTGKSSLLRSLAGLMNNQGIESSGTIKVWGEPLDHQHHLIALVAQKLQHLKQTVRANIVSYLPNRAQVLVKDQVEAITTLCHQYHQQWLLSCLEHTVMQLSKAQQVLLAIFRESLTSPDLLLIDEPTVGLNDQEADQVLTLIKQISLRTPVLMVSHHLRQTRQIADTVALMANGHIEEHKVVDEFYQSPQSELTQQYLRTGSCAEMSSEELDVLEKNIIKGDVIGGDLKKCDENQINKSKEIVLDPFTKEVNQGIVPSQIYYLKILNQNKHCLDKIDHILTAKSHLMGPNGFVWLIKGRLAGTPWPGIVGDMDRDLHLLKDVGITDLISLTEQPFESGFAKQYGMQVHHFPIVDMKVPTLLAAQQFCQLLDQMLLSDKKVALHCKAGLGRTGTMLAVYFLWQARGTQTAEQAVNYIRALNGMMIQSQEQVDFLKEIEIHLKNRG